MISGRNGDGDSFHIRHEKGESEFRLYFVDAPESAYRTYAGGADNGERLAEQGAYFGGLSREETIKVGEAGKQFVKNLLAKADFSILTRWENVYGPQRKYAFVIVSWQGQPAYLHEILVTKGLARIHTQGANLPNGRRAGQQKDFLRTLELKAREKKVGAWGL
ncbi:thermonuclease family protein [Roseibacillus ishigakijimensis]|uniref:thermonuclease family protein n=1 Tax=Roseibacillus ishigakijimensis TaxID=454146 RepID=UPI001903CABB|nr:thermonuclease family protein [Roseibacillus ishigakijimensis]